MPEYWRARMLGNVGGNGGGGGGEMGPWAPVRHMFAAALGQAGAFGQGQPVRGAPFHHLEHREKFIKRRLQKLGNSGGSRRSRDFIQLNFNCLVNRICDRARVVPVTHLVNE